MSAATAEALATNETNVVSDQIGEQVDRLGADVVLGEIKRSCYLVYVTIRAWAGRYVIPGAKVEIDGHNLDESLATLPQWKLMPDSWHKRIRPFEGKIRKIIRNVAVPFKDGVYLVPKKRAKDLIQEIKRIRAQYKEEVARFVEEWPKEVDKLYQRVVREAGDDQWLAVSKMIPDVRKLGALYDVEIGIWPGGGNEGLPVECIDHIDNLAVHLSAMEEIQARASSLGSRSPESEMAATLASVTESCRKLVDIVNRRSGRILDSNSEEWVEEAHSATNRLVAKAVENMINEPVREFQAAVGKLAEMREKGTCRGATLDVVRRAYAKLEGFEFLMPAEVMQRLREVDVRLGSMDPQAINGGSVAAQQISESLRAITDELVSDATQIQAFGHLSRNLDI